MRNGTRQLILSPLFICREKTKALASVYLVKKRSNREVVEELIYWRACRRGFGKKAKNVTRETTYLMQDNQDFFYL